jgi:hypothetical protein
MLMWRSVLMVLALGCGVEEVRDVDAFDAATGEARGGLVLSATDAAWGTEVTYTVTGAEPGAPFRLLFSADGEGEGSCPPPLDGLCLDILEPTSTLGSGVADDLGTVEFVVPLPDLCAAGRVATLQAGTIRPGPALTNVVSQSIEGIPVGVADAYTIDEDVVLDVPVEFGVLRNDRDCGGDGDVRAVLSRNPANGVLTLFSDGSFIYTPDADFSGSDDFRYTAVDDGGRSAAITVSLTVDEVADAPVAVDDEYFAVSGVELAVEAPGLLTNDSDADGDSLAAILTDLPSSGSLELSVDGSFVYVSAPGFIGEDSFTYVVSDGARVSEPATAVITVE